MQFKIIMDSNFGTICLILNDLQSKRGWLIIAKEGSRFSRFTVYLLWEGIKAWKRRKTEVDANCSTRLSVPCFPDWIFDLLLEMLKLGLSVAKTSASLCELAFHSIKRRTFLLPSEFRCQKLIDPLCSEGLLQSQSSVFA